MNAFQSPSAWSINRDATKAMDFHDCGSRPTGDQWRINASISRFHILCEQLLTYFDWQSHYFIWMKSAFLHSSTRLQMIDFGAGVCACSFSDFNVSKCTFDFFSFEMNKQYIADENSVFGPPHFRTFPKRMHWTSIDNPIVGWRTKFGHPKYRMRKLTKIYNAIVQYIVSSVLRPMHLFLCCNRTEIIQPKISEEHK